MRTLPLVWPYDLSQQLLLLLLLPVPASSGANARPGLSPACRKGVPGPLSPSSASTPAASLALMPGLAACEPAGSKLHARKVAGQGWAQLDGSVAVMSEFGAAGGGLAWAALHFQQRARQSSAAQRLMLAAAALTLGSSRCRRRCCCCCALVCCWGCCEGCHMSWGRTRAWQRAVAASVLLQHWVGF